jgi:hypothetical protein
MGMLISLICWVLMMLISFATMIYGWGLQPKSWLAIIIGTLATWLFALISAAATSK